MCIRDRGKSEFFFVVSTTKMYSTCSIEENDPVTPNVEVVNTILHRVQGIDPQMILANRLIQKCAEKESCREW